MGRADTSARRAERVTETADIVDATIDGRGIARTEGKTVFVRDAIAGETVRFVRRRKRRTYDEADLLEVLQPSPARTVPECEYFGVCGGCSLQHMTPGGQIQLKESVLLDNLRRIAGVEPERVLSPLTGSGFGYRRKARLAVKHVAKKGRVLVGFRERDKPYVTMMDSCRTLHPAIGGLLGVLSSLIGALTIRDRIPQIEAAAGDDATALVFRVLDPPSDADCVRLADFQQEHGARIFLQSGGPGSIMALNGETGPDQLHYRLPAFDVDIGFGATDFIQVHGEINRQMIDRAVKLLAPTPRTRLLDLFCGLGNFTLPLARHAGSVVGIEGSADMVRRAGDNARHNGIGNIEFRVADLADEAGAAVVDPSEFDSVLLDPPRTGAREVLASLQSGRQPGRALYVSCHSGTLARDAGFLVGDCGFRLTAAGVMDMFPHTGHVESMALFERY